MIQKIVLIRKDFWTGLHVGRSVIYIVKKFSGEEDSGTIKASIVEDQDDLHLAEKNTVIISTNRIQNRIRKRIVFH